MNVAKHMEVIFVAALALASVTGFATADSHSAAPQAVAGAGADVTPVHVVTVSAKRLSAAEKAAIAQ